MKNFRIILFALLSILLLGADGCITIGGSRQTSDGGVFRSETGGTTWAQVNFGGITEKGKNILYNTKSVFSLTFDPLHTETLYWGTAVNGILRSDDAGASWETTGLRTGGFRVVVPDPKSSGVVYTATGGVILKSGDGGNTWTTLYTETRPGQAIVALAVDAGATNTLYAATSDGVLIRSTDYGQTWSLHSHVQSVVQRFVFNPLDSRILYAMTDSRTLLVSSDGAKTWLPLSETLPALPGATVFNDFDFSPHDPKKMYAATARGLIASRDGGKNWEDVKTLIPMNTVPIQQFALHPQDAKTMYLIANNTLHTTHNGGSDWTVMPLPTAQPITAFLINPQKADQLFIGTLQIQK